MDEWLGIGLMTAGVLLLAVALAPVAWRAWKRRGRQVPLDQWWGKR